jgi:hypothetical protein
MVFDLRADCAKLQIIGYELQFAGEIGCQFMMLRREDVDDVGREGELGLAVEEAGDIVDDGLQVVRRLV